MGLLLVPAARYDTGLLCHVMAALATWRPTHAATQERGTVHEHGHQVPGSRFGTSRRAGRLLARLGLLSLC